MERESTGEPQRSESNSVGKDSTLLHGDKDPSKDPAVDSKKNSSRSKKAWSPRLNTRWEAPYLTNARIGRYGNEDEVRSKLLQWQQQISPNPLNRFNVGGMDGQLPFDLPGPNQPSPFGLGHHQQQGFADQGSMFPQSQNQQQGILGDSGLFPPGLSPFSNEQGFHNVPPPKGMNVQRFSQSSKIDMNKEVDELSRKRHGGERQSSLEDTKRKRHNDTSQVDDKSDKTGHVSIKFFDREKAQLTKQTSNGSKTHQLMLLQKVGISEKFDNKWFDPWKCFICDSAMKDWQNYVSHCLGNRHKVAVVKTAGAFNDDMRKKVKKNVKQLLTTPEGAGNVTIPVKKIEITPQKEVSNTASKTSEEKEDEIFECKPCGRYFNQYDKLSSHESSNHHWKRVNYLKNRFGAKFAEYHWYAQTNCQHRDKQEPLGTSFIVPISGYFCKLCSVFYNSDIQAKDIHCRQGNHTQRVKAFDRLLKSKTAGNIFDQPAVVDLLNSDYGVDGFRFPNQIGAPITKHSAFRNNRDKETNPDKGELGERQIRIKGIEREKVKIIQEWQQREKSRRAKFGSELTGQMGQVDRDWDAEMKTSQQEMEARENQMRLNETLKMERETRERIQEEEKIKSEEKKGRDRKEKEKKGKERKEKDRKEKDEKERKERKERKDRNERNERNERKEKERKEKERKEKERKERERRGKERKEKEKKETEQREERRHQRKLKHLQEQHEQELKKIQMVELAKLELRIKEQELRERDLAVEKEKLRRMIGNKSLDAKLRDARMNEWRAGGGSLNRNEDQLENDRKELRERRIVYESMQEIDGRGRDLNDIQGREKERFSIDAKKSEMRGWERKDHEMLQMQQMRMEEMKAQEMMLLQRQVQEKNMTIEMNRDPGVTDDVNPKMNAEMLAQQQEVERNQFLNDLRMKAIAELEMKTMQLRQKGLQDVEIQQLMALEQNLMEQRIVDELNLRGFANEGPAGGMRDQRDMSGGYVAEEIGRNFNEVDRLNTSQRIPDKDAIDRGLQEDLETRRQRELEYSVRERESSYSKQSGLDSREFEKTGMIDDKKGRADEWREMADEGKGRMDERRETSDERKGTLDADLQGSSQGRGRLDDGPDGRRAPDSEGRDSRGWDSSRRGRYHTDYTDDGQRARSDRDFDEGSARK